MPSSYDDHHIEPESVQNLRALAKSFTGITKPLKNALIPSTLDDLIGELHKVFAADHVNIDYVHHLMMSYTSIPAEWKKFAKFDRYRYTRNLVDEGNGKFNLMILCWGEGHGSAIHDHADSHCFMKMLDGELSEVRYAWPDDRQQGATDDPTSAAGEPLSSIAEMHRSEEDEEKEYCSSELVELSRSSMYRNEVIYINDSLGLHRVENPSHSNNAVSLHLYCPPFDACSVFNSKTGKRTTSKVTFWSKFGDRRDKLATTLTSPEDN